MNESAPTSGLPRDHAPAPGELRRGWRLAVVLLIVDKCWGGRASWTQLHLLSWGLLVRRDSAELARLLAGEVGVGEQVVGIDPAVNLAVDLALGEGLLERKGSGVGLTSAGESALNSLRELDVLQEERHILDGLGQKVSMSQAEDAIRGAIRA